MSTDHGNYNIWIPGSPLEHGTGLRVSETQDIHQSSQDAEQPEEKPGSWSSTQQNAQTSTYGNCTALESNTSFEKPLLIVNSYTRSPVALGDLVSSDRYPPRQHIYPTSSSIALLSMTWLSTAAILTLIYSNEQFEHRNWHTFPVCNRAIPQNIAYLPLFVRIAPCEYALGAIALLLLIYWTSLFCFVGHDMYQTYRLRWLLWSSFAAIAIGAATQIDITTLVIVVLPTVLNFGSVGVMASESCSLFSRRKAQHSNERDGPVYITC